jgi:hypothetical protein
MNEGMGDFVKAIEASIFKIKFLAIVDRFCTHEPGTCLYCTHKKKENG